MASASTEAWRRGAASKSSSAGVGLGVGIVRNPAMSGLEQRKHEYKARLRLRATYTTEMKRMFRKTKPGGVFCLINKSYILLFITNEF